jgi:hypothetical protein
MFAAFLRDLADGMAIDLNADHRAALVSPCPGD